MVLFPREIIKQREIATRLELELSKLFESVIRNTFATEKRVNKRWQWHTRTVNGIIDGVIAGQFKRDVLFSLSPSPSLAFSFSLYPFMTLRGYAE